MKENLREVIYKMRDEKELNRKGFFHGFGIDYLWSDGTGQCSVAIIESENGKIELISTDDFKFIKPYKVKTTNQ